MSDPTFRRGLGVDSISFTVHPWSLESDPASAIGVERSSPPAFPGPERITMCSSFNGEVFVGFLQRSGRRCHGTHSSMTLTTRWAAKQVRCGCGPWLLDTDVQVTGVPKRVCARRRGSRLSIERAMARQQAAAACTGAVRGGQRFVTRARTRDFTCREMYNAPPPLGSASSSRFAVCSVSRDVTDREIASFCLTVSSPEDSVACFL
jgi:hypothetical protein